MNNYITKKQQQMYILKGEKNKKQIPQIKIPLDKRHSCTVLARIWTVKLED